MSPDSSVSTADTDIDAVDVSDNTVIRDGLPVPVGVKDGVKEMVG